MIRKLQSFDRFGYKIALNFQHEEQYKTIYGFIVTVIAFSGVLAYFGIQLKAVINYESTQLLTMEYYNDLINAPFRDHYTLENMDFAILLTVMDNTGDIDKRILIDFQENMHKYAEVYINTVVSEMIYDSNVNKSADSKRATDSFTWDQSPVEVIKCPESRFPKNQSFNFQNAYCPKNLNFSLMGNIYSKYEETIEIGIRRCQQDILNKTHPGEKCINETLYNKLKPLMSAYFIVKTQFFDSNDYTTNPIKGSFRSYLSFPTDKSSQFLYLRASQNSVLLQDSRISNYFNSQTLKFTNIDFQQQTMIQDDSNIFYINIVQDEKQTQIQRSIFTIVSAFSQIGGFMGIITSFCIIITSGIEKVSFYSAAISEIYKTPSVSSSSSASNNRPNENKVIDISSSEFHQENDHKKSIQQLQEKMKIKLDWRDVLLYQCRFILPCYKKNSRQLLMKKGIQKISQDLDIMSILKKLNQVEAMKQILLSKTQQQLIQFSKHHIIVDNEDDEDKAHEHVQELLGSAFNSYISKKSQNESPHIKRSVNLKLQKLLGLSQRSQISQAELQDQIDDTTLTKQNFLQTQKHRSNSDSLQDEDSGNVWKTDNDVKLTTTEPHRQMSQFQRKKSVKTSKIQIRPINIGDQVQDENLDLELIFN